jgi:hypothetical protein
VLARGQVVFASASGPRESAGEREVDRAMAQMARHRVDAARKALDAQTDAINM